MIDNNDKPNDSNKLGLNAVLTTTLGSLIKINDIKLDEEQTKNLTKEEKEKIAADIRASFIIDLADAVAPVIRDNYGTNKLSEKISAELLVPERGKEDQATSKGRVAKFIRDVAGSGFFFATSNDEIIKNELAKKIDKLLIENADNIKTALVIEGSGQNMSKGGVVPPKKDFGEKVYGAAEQGVANSWKPIGEISRGIYNGIIEIFPDQNPKQSNSAKSSTPGRR